MHDAHSLTNASCSYCNVKKMQSFYATYILYEIRIYDILYVILDILIGKIRKASTVSRFQKQQEFALGGNILCKIAGCRAR